MDRHDPTDPMTATEAEVPLARESSRRMMRYSNRSTPLSVTPAGGKKSDAVVLPASAVRMLVRLLAEMAEGRAVTLIPVQAELTTQQAADMLGVSRPFVIKQIKEGRLPHRRIGTHRRVMLNDLMAYKQRLEADRSTALSALAAEAQRLNLGY